MKSLKDKILDLLLAVFAVLFLLVGVTALGDDASGILLGFGTAIPLTAVFFWRKRREARGQSVKIGILTLLLFMMTLLFWVVCLTALDNAGEELALVLVPCLILGAAYAVRRRRELRAADAVLEPVDLRPAAAPTKPTPPVPSAQPAVVPVTVCPTAAPPARGMSANTAACPKRPELLPVKAPFPQETVDENASFSPPVGERPRPTSLGLRPIHLSE